MGAIWNILVVEIDGEKVPGKVLKKFNHENPRGKPGMPFLLVKFFAMQDKINRLRDHCFGDFKEPLKSGMRLLHQSPHPLTKIAALRECKEIEQQQRAAGCWVWYPNPPIYRVYAIRLQSQIIEKEKKFHKKNGSKKSYKGYFYVGQTSSTLRRRFEQHTCKNSEGEPHKFHNAYVHNYCDGAYPDAFATEYCFEGMTHLESLEREQQLGEVLQQQGFAVWWG